MDVADIAAAVPIIPADAGFQLLGGGNVNDTWKVTSSAGTWVVRIDRQLAINMELDRAAERKAMQAARPTGLVPDIIWVNEARGILVTEFIEGQPLSSAAYSDPMSWPALGEALGQLHALVPDVPVIDFAARAELYASLATDGAAMQLAAEVAELANRWCSNADRFALCHNDPGPSNIISTPDGLRLIDWEYAGLGEPCFDLAAAIATHELDSAATQHLLAAYGYSVEPDLLAGCSALYDRLAILWLMVTCARHGAPKAYLADLQALKSRLSL